MPDTCAWIFANGEQAHLERLQPLLQPDDYLVAADGGLRHIFSLGREPDVLIGDLDSVSSEEIARVERAGGRIIRHPAHKDETDLELAIQLVLGEGYRDIRIAGGLGGRLDMTLANLFLLMLPGLEDVEARLEDGTDEVFLIRPGKPGRGVDGQIGDRLSLLAWGGAAAGIWTEGLYYPLQGETLYPERTRGVSNLMILPRARVELEAGLLLCIHTRLSDQDSLT